MSWGVLRVLSRFFAHRTRRDTARRTTGGLDGLVGPVYGFTRVELRRRIEGCNWAHSIDLGDGFVTPGAWPVESQADIRQAFAAISFAGKKVLDIGCWDGLWSFEAERRGAAEVYATDDITQRPYADQPTLILARAYLGSRIKYFPRLRAQDVALLGVFDVDVVIFTGIYYHLKDPLLAFGRLRRVMKEGAVIIVEGEVIDSTECFARFYYHEQYAGDASNWWVPTVPCLRQWIECSFFDEIYEYPCNQSPNRRVLTARAVRRTDTRYAFPDKELDGYFS
jgi:tRNA (mo5U34)-methyltransferase